MNLSDIAKIWLKATVVACPEPVTIAPRTKLETVALLELRERNLIEQYDMWPNGDRRWIVTPAGRAALVSLSLTGNDDGKERRETHEDIVLE